METAQYDAFWSYAHADDERQRGRVLGLADDLLDEFFVSTGDELNLFRDRHSLEWGDLWRERIDKALGEAPFFIAVITPRFMRSEECRRELLRFNGATSDGKANKLILPLLYIPVPGMSPDSDDEVLALIARTQYVDLTDIRLRDPSDPVVLRALNNLALRIHELRKEVSGEKVAAQTRAEDRPQDDLEETLGEIESRLDQWMDSVEFDKVAGSRWRAVRDERVGRAQRLSGMRGQRGAVRSVFVKLGDELWPIANDRLEKAKKYSRLTIELDPFVTSAIRQVNDRPIFLPLLDSLRDGIEEAYLNMEPPDPDNSGFGLPTDILQYSQRLIDADQALSACSMYVTEGNGIVMQWRRGLGLITGEETEPFGVI
jgi:hypothetical protein